MKLFTLTISYFVAFCLKCVHTRELRLLGLMPMSGGWSGGGPCLQALQMALSDINTHADILKHFDLKLDYIDTRCNPGTALFQMFDKLNAEQAFLMVIGDGCSVVSEATAQVTHLWNLTQLSYGSVSPVLADRTRYPNFFRLSTPDQKHNAVRIAMMRKFNWRKVATINQALEFFSAVIEDFVKRVRNTDITILSQEIFTADPMTRVQNLKDRDARIIITAMYEDKARALLCAAFKVGLYGPKIVWFFTGWYSKDFWKENLDDIDCTEEELAVVAEGSFLSRGVIRNPFEERGIANITGSKKLLATYKSYSRAVPGLGMKIHSTGFLSTKQGCLQVMEPEMVIKNISQAELRYVLATVDLRMSEFDDEFFSHPDYNIDAKNYDFIGPQCYDTMWVAANALDCTVKHMHTIDHPKALDNFTYVDGDINDIILECLENMTYTGLIGTIMFEHGDPDKMIRLERIQGGERVHIGYHRQDRHPAYFEWFQDGIQWKDNSIPRDSTLITYEEIICPRWLSVSMMVSAVCGNGLTLALFTFNVMYRQNSYVKLSSPNINNVLLLGCILCYCTVFFKTTEITSSVICKARIFCFCMGFTCTFGALFSKTWRVYRIFTNKKLLRITIKDRQLFAIVGGMEAVVVVVLVIWESVGPHRVETKYLEKEIYLNGNDAEVHPYVRVCKSDYSAYFGWALYIIEGLLLSFGAFLAWETRHVTIQALNDSRQIGLCVYNDIILSAVGLMLSLVLEDEEVVMYGVTSGFLIFGTTLTQLMIFIPKIQAVRNKVSGTDLVTTGLNNMTIGTNVKPSLSTVHFRH